MKNRTVMRWLLLAVLLPAMTLVACTYQAKDNVSESNATLAHNAGGDDESDGIGGTGLQPEGDGIGGTGMLAEGDGLGGTGIIGPISGFGSIVVNGIHIDYPADMVIGLNGQTASTKELKIGRVVEVHASSATGRLAARSIEVLDAVIGPVEAINRQDGSVRVLGQQVYLDSQTVLFSNLDIQGVLKSLKPGDLLRVSGLHLANGSLVATRMEPADPGVAWFVTGVVRGLDTDGFSIGGLQVKRGAVWPKGLRNGSSARVRGERVDGRFLAQELSLRADVPFDGMVERLVIQGYPRPATHPDALRIGNLQVEMPTDAATKDTNLRTPLTLQRIQLTARIERNGDIRAERITTIRLAPAAVMGGPLPLGNQPSIPKREIKWNQTPEKSFPKPPVLDSPIRRQRPLPRPSIKRQIRLERPVSVRRPMALIRH